MKKLAIVLVLIVGALGWRALRSDTSDSKLVFDRFWVDHVARGRDDQFQALMIRSEHPWGHFAVQTPWRGTWEGFHYHVLPRSDGQLDLFFPAPRRASA